jgi:hypothetical protein
MGTLDWICQDRMIFSADGAGFTSVIGDADRQQLIAAIGAAAGSWWLLTTALPHCSIFVRIFLLTGLCISIYLIVVVGLFRLTEPIKVAGAVVQDPWRNR